MSTATTSPPVEGTSTAKEARVPFGRWFKLVGWRHLVAIFFSVWALVPTLYVLNLAFSGGNTLTAACPPDKEGLEALSCIFPTTFSTANFEAILTSDQYPFMKWFGNTLAIAIMNSFGALLMGAAAAYAFSRLRFAGRRMGMLALLLVQMFPAILAVTAYYALLRQIGEVFPAVGLGTIGGLTLVYLGGALGVNTFLMKGYFDTIPVDIDESARIDGAGHFRIFAQLILRLATPILVVVFFITFQSTFNELGLAQQLMPDFTNTTLAVGLNGLVSDPLRQQWGLMAAGGVISAIPLVIVFIFAQRSLVTGLTAGAVKG